MTRDESTAQMCRAMAMTNRITVAKIKLKRAETSSEVFDSEMREISNSISALNDCLILGDDVESSLDEIESRLEAFEAGI